jgi:hypothetical protein
MGPEPGRALHDARHIGRSARRAARRRLLSNPHAAVRVRARRKSGIPDGRARELTGGTRTRDRRLHGHRQFDAACGRHRRCALAGGARSVPRPGN